MDRCHRDPDLNSRNTDSGGAPYRHALLGALLFALVTGCSDSDRPIGHLGPRQATPTPSHTSAGKTPPKGLAVTAEPSAPKQLPVQKAPSSGPVGGDTRPGPVASDRPQTQTPLPRREPSWLPPSGDSTPTGAAPDLPKGKPQWGVLDEEDAPPVPGGKPYQHVGVRTADSDQVDTPVHKPLETSRSEVDNVSQQQLSSLAWQGTLPADIEKADEFARKAPRAVSNDLKTLASYLKGAGPTPFHQLRAIYAWEAHNIEYDPVVIQGGKPTTSQHPPDVLRNRKAVCDGFARLYVVLAHEMGLEAEHLIGEAQSDGFGQVVGSSGNRLHRWVRAKVSPGEQHCWMLIDPTWGRVSHSGGGWHYSDRYFNLEPSEFLKGHFPRDPKWQLMTPPVSEKGWRTGVRPQLHQKEGKSGKGPKIINIKIEGSRPSP